MRTIVSLLPAAMVVAGVGVSAGEVTPEDFELKTTRELYDVCTTPEEHEYVKYAIGTCLGYILGAAHYHRAASSPETPSLACPPDDLNLVDLARIFAEWAQRHEDDPALMQELPVQGVMRASVEQWPCPSDP